MGAFTGKDGLMHNTTLPYPALEDVEKADRRVLAQWVRFLASPGLSAIDKGLEEFTRIADGQKVVLTRIIERFEEMGGWDSVLSKQIGWSL